MRSAFSRFAAAFALFIAALSVSAKDRLMDSLEWASIDAEMIVRAKASASQSMPAYSGDFIHWNLIDLEILETIKGPAASHLKVAEPIDQRGSGITIDSNNWEMLIFLDRRQRFSDAGPMFGQCEWVVRKQGGWYATHNSSEAIFSNQSEMQSLTGESFTGSQLLDRVRKAAAWSLHARDMPHRKIENFTYSWQATGEDGMIIPTAEPFIQQMRDFIVHDDSKQANSNSKTLPPWNEWNFDGRERVYRLMKALDIPADRPIFNGPADIHEPAGRTLIGVVLILLAWPIGWFFARRKNGERFRFGSMLAIWRIAIASALTVAWLLSYRQACSIVWQQGGQRWQLASYEGVLRLSRVADINTQSPRPQGIVGGIFYPDPQNPAEWNLRNVTLLGGWEKWGASIGEGTPVATSSGRYNWGNFGRQVRPLPAIWVAIIPWQWIVCTIGPLALVLGISQLRRCNAHRTRSRRGYCTVCGYDLRATPERCPECGAKPEPPAQKA